ncbi:unnamed protein product [Pylaiella littoralis]
MGFADYQAGFGNNKAVNEDSTAATTTTITSTMFSDSEGQRRTEFSTTTTAMPQWHMPTGYDDHYEYHHHHHQHHHHQQQQQQYEQAMPPAGCFGASSSASTSTSSTSSAGAASGDFPCSPSKTSGFHDNMSLEMLTNVLPLDKGGFCVACSCTYMGQRAVLKVPKRQGPKSAIADLLVEIGIYKRISERGGHPNIAHAFGSGFYLLEEKPTPFLVLELLEGGSLAEAIERSRRESDADSAEGWSDPMSRLPVALELADALQFLHRDAIPCGFILHRDIKPTNIGLSAEGHVKVFDLGLSVVQEVRGGSQDQKYQMSGMAGSKRFMSPEVCKGLPYNEKVDVYSFAIVLWELCTLRKPFAGMNVADHYREVVIGRLRPPLHPQWPAGLQNLMQACWHEDPDHRPSILEAREILLQICLVEGGWAA